MGSIAFVLRSQNWLFSSFVYKRIHASFFFWLALCPQWYKTCFLPKYISKKLKNGHNFFCCSTDSDETYTNSHQSSRLECRGHVYLTHMVPEIFRIILGTIIGHIFCPTCTSRSRWDRRIEISSNSFSRLRSNRKSRPRIRPLGGANVKHIQTTVAKNWDSIISCRLRQSYSAREIYLTIAGRISSCGWVCSCVRSVFCAMVRLARRMQMVDCLLSAWSEQ